MMKMGLLVASIGTGAPSQWGGNSRQWWISVKEGKTKRGKQGQKTAGNQGLDQLLTGATPGRMGGMNSAMMFEQINRSADEEFAGSLDDNLFGQNVDPLQPVWVHFSGLPPRIIKKAADATKKNGGANPFGLMDSGE